MIIFPSTTGRTESKITNKSNKSHLDLKKSNLRTRILINISIIKKYRQISSTHIKKQLLKNSFVLNSPKAIESIAMTIQIIVCK